MSRNRFKRALLIGSGEDVPEKVPVANGEGLLIICADGGAQVARNWGLSPAVIVGDQDSIDTETKNYWAEKRVPFLKFPVAKDKTDLDLAVDYAINEGVKEIILTGGWGSRIDHSLGNVGLLYSLAKRGITNSLVTKESSLFACFGQFAASVQVGSIISLLPLTPVVHNVTSKGLRYSLEGVNLSKGSTLGISNEAVAKKIQLKFASGILLVVLV